MAKFENFLITVRIKIKQLNWLNINVPLKINYMKYFYQFFILLFFVFNSSFSQSSFYYYKGEKIHLDKVENEVVVQSNRLVSNFSGGLILNSLDNNEGKINTIVRITKSDFQKEKIRLFENNQVNFVFPVYENFFGKKISVTNYLYFKLKSLSDINTLKKIADEYHLESLSQNKYMPLWYSCKIKNRKNNDPIELANTLYETGIFIAVEADIFNIEGSIRCTNDGDFGLLWGLNNNSGPDVKACEAWNLTDGSGSTVAIIDKGVDLDHSDLSANIVGSYDTETDTSPSKIYDSDSHGSMIAGIIGAESNNEQVVGLAHGASLLSISNAMDGTANGREKKANGILWAVNNGADVISNSWSIEPSLFVEDAIDIAREQGRSGRGCVIVHPTGNSSISYVEYPANLFGVMAVGAVSQSGTRASFSNYGYELDVVAPGDDIWSTSLNDNISKGDGTSYAVPYVSGIAALAFSANPFLTEEEAREIIKKTAQKVGGYNYNNSNVYGTYNENVGHGLIDAEAVVENAIELDAPDAICTGESNVFSIKGAQFQGATITWEYPNNKMYIISGNGTSNCTFGSFTSGLNQIVKANVSYNGNTYVFRKTIDVLSSYQPSAPTIDVADNSPQNLYCCGTSYIFDHAKCVSGCTDLEWEETIYSQNANDNYSFIPDDSEFRLHVNKNTYSPLVIGVRARRYNACNNNPSDWSNEISKYYGTVAGSASNQMLTPYSSETINTNFPIQEYYLNSDKNLYIYFIELFQWLDLNYSNKNLTKEEISSINFYLRKQYLKPQVKIQIYDFNGTIIKTKNVFQNNVINLSALKPGIYFINYNYYGKEFIRKIIKES